MARIIYGEEDEVEKKTPESTVPSGVKMLPAHEPTIAAETTPKVNSNLPQSVTINTTEMPELQPHRPAAQTIPNYGWNLNKATMTAAEDALQSMAGKPYGRKAAFGGRTIDQLIEDVSTKYGGMENLRSRSSSTSGGMNLSEQSSAPVLGRYLEGLLERGPSNRLENILLRRYYANVGQQSRSMTRGEDYARSENLGASPVPQILGDVLSAQNIAEDIGLTAQQRAVAEIMSGEISKGANRADIYNQLVTSGTGLMGDEMRATASVLGDLTGGRTTAQTPAERFMSAAPEYIMNEEGMPDPDKINAVRKAFGETTQTTLPTTGQNMTRGANQLPVQTGTNIPRSQISGTKPLPASLKNIASRNNLTYQGATDLGNGRIGYVFVDANGMQVVIPYIE